MASTKPYARFGHLPNYFSRNEPDKIDARLVDALAEGAISMKEYGIYMNCSPEELDQVGALHSVDEETEKFATVPHPRATPAPEDFEQALAGLEAGMRFMVRAGIPADAIKDCIYRTKAWGAFKGMYSGAIPAAEAIRPAPAPRPKPAPAAPKASPPKQAPKPTCCGEIPPGLYYPLLQKKKSAPFGGDGLQTIAPMKKPVSAILPQGPPPPPSGSTKPAPVQRAFNNGGGAEFRDCFIRECDLESQPGWGFAKAMGPCVDNSAEKQAAKERVTKMMAVAKAMGPGVEVWTPRSASAEKQTAEPEADISAAELGQMLKSDGVLPEPPSAKDQAAAAEKSSEAQADRERKTAEARELAAKLQAGGDIGNLELDEFVFIGADGEEHPIMFLKSKKK